MSNPNTPVLVGVGQFLNRIQSLSDTIEPVDMMLRASRLAQTDTEVGNLLEHVQSVRVIRGVWNYDNPAAYIAEQIGAARAETAGTLFGGNYVQSVVNQTARAILAGELELALLTGAEIGNSAAKARKVGQDIALRTTPGTYDVLFGTDQQSEHHDNERARGIKQAIQIYPMYENALRFHLGESMHAHALRVSELWSRFNDVAVHNPNAWVRDDLSAEQIRTPSATNRQISFPYTKFMNANMSVDMGAALILCSVSKARALGIPERKWIYPHAGVEGRDHFSASVRDNFHTSPGIRIIGRTLEELASTPINAIEHVDLYSCFPSAVQIAARELGLEETRPLTVTGGLTFGGGPLNNYVMHSIARMAEVLRENPEDRGLVTANGGNLYKHAHCIYSAQPPSVDFAFKNVQADIDALPSRQTLAEYQGAVTIESYTVMYGADAPSIAHAACLTPEGHRVWANSGDTEMMADMTRTEFCGRPGHVTRAGELTAVS